LKQRINGLSLKSYLLSNLIFLEMDVSELEKIDLFKGVNNYGAY